ncbi:MAG: C4-dicarboxylate ABC transporter substrate-binding protein, partial [candidate division NC10 bacterium]|nr:C4-dicarboxylate ABC transporter substrate-binding protein [candidate division NC10 bacterium]
PDDLVYGITKALAKNADSLGAVVKDVKGLTAKEMAFDVGVPYHPGALKYYKEAGALK